MSDVYVSYAMADAEWARTLAQCLAEHGVEAFFDEWSLRLGDNLVHKADDAMRETSNGIAVISPAAMRSPWAMEEYAALVRESAMRGLRFIPVLIGDVDLPPFAATNVWVDFRTVRPSEPKYAEKVGELVGAILGRPSDATGGAIPVVPPENFAAALPSPPRPITPPDQPAIVICYSEADQVYGYCLAGQVRRAGLPVWSVADLRPGDSPFWLIRQQLAHATVIIVVMSKESQDSDDITDMILEGQRLGRPFFPILLHGDLNYHLQRYWFADARNGRLPGAEELVVLSRLHKASLAGTAIDLAALLPQRAGTSRGPASAVRVPSAHELSRLDGYLRAGELEHADLLTTTILLDAAGRLEEGWMRSAQGERLPEGLLADVDELWSRHTHDRQGFRAQQSLACVDAGAGHKDFARLSVAFGWRESARDVPGRYSEFSQRFGPGGRGGFFPTLRNPQNEIYKDWYNQWMATVLAVHARLRVLRR